MIVPSPAMGSKYLSEVCVLTSFNLVHCINNLSYTIFIIIIAVQDLFPCIWFIHVFRLYMLFLAPIKTFLKFIEPGRANNLHDVRYHIIRKKLYFLGPTI